MRPLDDRLALVADMYQPCEVGADIGTDHAMLPVTLLRNNICQRMVLSDISPDALDNARARMEAEGLTDRCTLRLADGLDAVDRPMGCISVTGMGGRMEADMLLRGQERLHGAVLVLSAHTDLPLVRRALHRIGYVIRREEAAFAAGRLYLVWRAEPGQSSPTELDFELGTALLRDSNAPAARSFRQKQLKVLRAHREGLLLAGQCDARALDKLQTRIDVLERSLT